MSTGLLSEAVSCELPATVARHLLSLSFNQWPQSSGKQTPERSGKSQCVECEKTRQLVGLSIFVDASRAMTASAEEWPQGREMWRSDLE